MEWTEIQAGIEHMIDEKLQDLHSTVKSQRLLIEELLQKLSAEHNEKPAKLKPGLSINLDNLAEKEPKRPSTTRASIGRTVQLAPRPSTGNEESKKKFEEDRKKKEEAKKLRDDDLKKKREEDDLKKKQLMEEKKKEQARNAEEKKKKDEEAKEKKRLLEAEKKRIADEEKKKKEEEAKFKQQEAENKKKAEAAKKQQEESKKAEAKKALELKKAEEKKKAEENKKKSEEDKKKFEEAKKKAEEEKKSRAEPKRNPEEIKKKLEEKKKQPEKKHPKIEEEKKEVAVEEVKAVPSGDECQGEESCKSEEPIPNTLEEIEALISQLKTDYKEEELTEASAYILSPGSISALSLLTTMEDGKFYFDTIPDKQVIWAFRVFFQLMKQTLPEDDTAAWEQCRAFFLDIKNKDAHEGQPINTVIIEKIQTFDFSQENLDLLENLVVGNQQNLNPQKYTDICALTGLIMFTVREALIFGGIAKGSTPVSNIYARLLHKKSNCRRHNLMD
ncbi:unnamed protein product [Blepharisma stoltei]|uniref:Uncharacterized protein n=1 Tax=Blepharisma stoltei TaxID=1481888 RepID=A0AAU9K0D5_9CILI|nr:unnamed protein product [Blepharisma stoltei]